MIEMPERIMASDDGRWHARLVAGCGCSTVCTPNCGTEYVRAYVVGKMVADAVRDAHEIHHPTPTRPATCGECVLIRRLDLEAVAMALEGSGYVATASVLRSLPACRHGEGR